MTARCKPGDIAITVNAPRENGKIVDVIRIADLQRGVSIVDGPHWLIQSKGSPFEIRPGFICEYAVWPDSMLRPIGNPKGDDQTVTWAGKPEGVTA